MIESTELSCEEKRIRSLEKEVKSLKKFVSKIKKTLNALKIYVILLVPVIFALLLNAKNKVSLDSPSLEHTIGFIFITAVCIAGLLQARKVKKLMIRTKNPKEFITYIILIPIVSAALIGFIINLIRFIPTLYNKPIVQVAKGQAISPFKSFSFNSFVFTSYEPPLNEELFFKFIFLLAFYFLALMLLRILFTPSKLKLKESTLKPVSDFAKYVYRSIMGCKYNKLLGQKGFIFRVLFTLIISYFFAMAHQPDASNFYMYFLSGVAGTYLVLRYGYFSGVVCHFTFNFSSPLMMVLAANLFKLFTK